MKKVATVHSHTQRNQPWISSLSSEWNEAISSITPTRIQEVVASLSVFTLVWILFYLV